MYNSIRSIKNGRKWQHLVGYSIEDLKVHLEKGFYDGMSWDAFLKGDIHIDHKIPLAVFNFKTPDDIDFQKAWALSNLQPMWAKENIMKSNKLEASFQPSLAFGGAYQQ